MSYTITITRPTWVLQDLVSAEEDSVRGQVDAIGPLDGDVDQHRVHGGLEKKRSGFKAKFTQLRTNSPDIEIDVATAASRFEIQSNDKQSTKSLQCAQDNYIKISIFSKPKIH